MIKPLVILFLLGALQGAIGWIMVASGLTGDAIYVKPTRLALHFVFALGLLCYTFWFALQLLVPKGNMVVDIKLRKLAVAIIVILILQLIYGALMAGHKAATAAPTWPDINGAFIPAGMMREEGLLNFIDNRITIHFIHRGLAYLLLGLVVWFTIKLYRNFHAGVVYKTGWLPVFLVSLQVVLGILSVLFSTSIIPNQWGIFEWMAQLHQLVAMFLLLSLVWFLYLIRRKPVL
jgi:cytochrome c oxidase assembly protein subunit 15